MRPDRLVRWKAGGVRSRWPRVSSCKRYAIERSDGKRLRYEVYHLGELQSAWHSFGEALQACQVHRQTVLVDMDEETLARAAKLHNAEGRLRIQEDARIKRHRKGAWVAAWVWVPNE